MKTVNITFTDEEYEKLKEVKERKGLNWHDFVLLIVEESEEE